MVEASQFMKDKKMESDIYTATYLDVLISRRSVQCLQTNSSDELM